MIYQADRVLFVERSGELLRAGKVKRYKARSRRETKS